VLSGYGHPYPVAENTTSGKRVAGSLPVHFSPLGWVHINLTGDYIWRANRRVVKDRFRPLRQPRETAVRWLKAVQHKLLAYENFRFSELIDLEK
jgi:hypothetical protein